MQAEQVIKILTGGTCPAWVSQAALLFRPNRFGKTYDTTQVQFFTEVTVRIPAVKVARRSNQSYDTLQRRRMDLVGLVQPNYRAYEPLAIGVEIKVDKYDLIRDSKVLSYLPYVHLFYLAVPDYLAGLAREVLALKGGSGNELAVLSATAGLLVVKENGRISVDITPRLTAPADQHLKELYAELLIKRRFKTEGSES